MSKKVSAVVKIQIPAGGATPAPPVGSALGPHGIKTMDFCKDFNAQTSNRSGQLVPVEVTIYADRSFSFITKTPLVSELIRKKLGLQKGSKNPGTEVAGKISWSDIKEIAEVKMPDLNAVTVEQASKIIAGSARSMGIEVVD